MNSGQPFNLGRFSAAVPLPFRRCWRQPPTPLVGFSRGGVLRLFRFLRSSVPGLPHRFRLSNFILFLYSAVVSTALTIVRVWNYSFLLIYCCHEWLEFSQNIWL